MFFWEMAQKYRKQPLEFKYAHAYDLDSRYLLVFYNLNLYFNLKT